MTVRLLFLVPQDLQSPSGLGRYFPLASELASRGNIVEIAALHSDFDALETRTQDIRGVRVHYVAAMHVRKRGSTKQYYSIPRLLLVTLTATIRLSVAALRSSADVVYICKPLPMNSIAGLLFKILRPKLRVYLDCDDFEAVSNRFGGAWQRKLIAFFENRMPFLSDRVSSNTYFSINRIRLLGVPKENLVYLPNGVDRTRFSDISPARVDALRAELSLQGHPVIIYIGSLSLPSHPVNLLLDAFARLHVRIPQARLLIVGGGEDLDTLKQQARRLAIDPFVCFTGRVAPDRIPDYFRLGDVSVDPVYDTPAAAGRAPLKMFESWASGVPFVTMDVGDRRMIAGDPPAALITEPGSDNQLALAMEEILVQPGLSEELTRRGYQRVEDFYWDRIVERAAWIVDMKSPVK